MFALNVRLAGLVDTSTLDGEKLNEVITGAWLSCESRAKYENTPKIMVVTVFKML